eukprot:745794-Hanusia_phi.AAC.4
MSLLEYPWPPADPSDSTFSPALGVFSASDCFTQHRHVTPPSPGAARYRDTHQRYRDHTYYFNFKIFDGVWSPSVGEVFDP